MILSCADIGKSFGERDVLSKVSFHIEDREKAAVVGRNGAGKSTLFKILAGEIAPDEGEAVLAKGATLGYLAQHQDLAGGRSVYEELLDAKKGVLEIGRKLRETERQMRAASGEDLEHLLNAYARLNHEFEMENGYACQSEVTGVLKGLGFLEEDFGKPTDVLSGGQKTRVALGKLLLSAPDVILLDEPTNHLDMGSIAWLENFLLGYGGAALIVSHDRYFLDRVVSKVIDIDHGKCAVYAGNYTAYAQKRDALLEASVRQYENQQKVIQHQEEVIQKLRSFNREKSIRRAESREKLLDKMEVLDRPDTEERQIRLRLAPARESGNDVLSIEGLSKSFDGRELFSGLSLSIKKGERVALIGDNGTGKTTLLKIINGLLPADSGILRLGSNVTIGYYDQEHHVLDMGKTPFDELSDAYPDMDNTSIRNVLAAFLFTGDEVFQKIGDLSGGERGRVSLAKLMLSKANFLILDEPTNHLDISSKEVLEDALRHFAGTALYVSHDRYFINQTATRVLDLTEGRLLSYIGNYDYYLEKKKDMEAAHPASSSAAPGPEEATDAKAEWRQKKEERARERKRQNDLKRCEEEIDALEARNGEIDALLVTEEVFTDPERLLALHREKTALEERLSALMEEWEELAQ